MSDVTRYHAIGKRKTSVARVWLAHPGEGKITINNRPMEEYLTMENAKILVRQPVELTETDGRVDIAVNVRGGGIAGQAGAIKHGIARALIEYDPEMRKVLKKAGFLRRDARARFQYSKR